MMIRFLLAAMLVAFTGVAIAASGGSPNGKPFVELQGALVEVKQAVTNINQRIETLFSRVSSLEDAQDRAEKALFGLEIVQKDLLIALSEAEARFMTQDELFEKFSSEIERLKEASIATQQDIDIIDIQLQEYEQLLILLESSTQDVIDILDERITSNTLLIEAIQSDLISVSEVLELKQNIINGTCPLGEAVYSILGSGSISCRPSSSVNDEVITSYATLTNTRGNRHEVIDANCPEGTQVFSGGFIVDPVSSWQSVQHYAVSGSIKIANGWRIKFSQYNDYTKSVIAQAYCRVI